MTGNGNRRRLEPTAERDYCSERGARELAEAIEGFWKGFGHSVRVMGRTGAGLWCVGGAKLAQERSAAPFASAIGADRRNQGADALRPGIRCNSN